MNGNHHPADEKLLEHVADYLRRRAHEIGVGDVLTLKLGRGNNNRLTFHGANLADNNPLADDAREA